jgi:hypothetical protein
MAQIKYRCNKCNEEITISFSIGRPPLTSPICSKCCRSMVRQFNNVDIGNIVDKKMIDVANMFTHGKLPSGKDKIIF